MQKWMIPCNVKNFDVVEHLKTKKLVCFKRNRAIELGDEVYIYVASPYSGIKYKGIVTRTGITPNEVGKEYKISCMETKTFIEVEVTKTFADHLLDGAELKKHGLGKVVNQQPIRDEIEKYISTIDEANN